MRATWPRAAPAARRPGVSFGADWHWLAVKVDEPGRVWWEMSTCSGRGFQSRSFWDAVPPSSTTEVAFMSVKAWQFSTYAMKSIVPSSFLGSVEATASIRNFTEMWMRYLKSTERQMVGLDRDLKFTILKNCKR